MIWKALFASNFGSRVPCPTASVRSAVILTVTEDQSELIPLLILCLDSSTISLNVSFEFFQDDPKRTTDPLKLEM